MMNPFLTNFDKIKERRDLIVNKDHSFIFDLTPYLPAYSGIIPGLIRGDNVLITAQSGVGKSKFVRWMIKILRHACRKKNVPIKIFYNSLEESPEKIYASQVMTYLSYKYNRRLSFHQILHYADKDSVLSNADYQLVEKAYKELAELQGDELVVMSEPNPYGIYKRVRQYLYETGTFYSNNKPVVYVPGEQFPLWDRYEPNNPNALVVTVTDTIDKLSATNGKTLYDSVHYFASTYMDTILAQKCNTINFFVQQQIPLSDANIFYKGSKTVGALLPTLDNLRTCKAVRESVSLAFGLFNPEEHKLDEYLGFDVRSLKGLLRSITLLKNRNGELDTRELPILLDATAETFMQMSKDKEYWYEYVKKKN